MIIEPGVLLVAHPRLPGPVFDRSVVLITEHSASGTVGLVINKPSPYRLSEIMSAHGVSYSGSDRIYLGGPVQNRALSILHEEPRSGNVMQVKSWWVSSDHKMLVDLADGEISGCYRAVAGMSGWAPNQLAREIAQDQWLLLPATTERLFGKTHAAQYAQCLDDCAATAMDQYL